MHAKINILLGLFFLLFVGLIIRLSYWQVVMAGTLSARAQNQYMSSTVTSAPRGNILASDGSYWVLRNNVWQITANPKLLKQSPHLVGLQIAPFLIDNESDSASVAAQVSKLENQLSRNNTSWVALKDKVSDSVKKNIEALTVAGLEFNEQEGRFYPEASSAAHILGFVGKDNDGENIGYFGLEGYYNLPLSGKSGFVGQEKDAKGTPILLGGTKNIDAIGGVDLVTTVDKRVQLLIERKLNEGLEKYGAKGGSITVMDPFTGEILGMTSSPAFDPSKYSEYKDTLFRNPIISNSFEPGSIFKPIVMAAAIDGGFVTPETRCDICDGPLNVDGYTIKTWNNKYRPNSSMDEIIVESDNVGMSFIASKMGVDNFTSYIQKFGIGSPTGVDLQGEASPPLRKKGTWSKVDLATASFGQGIAITGIQMIRAVSAIANGGLLPTPHLVKSIKADGWEQSVELTKPTRIISEKAAGEVTRMMVDAANLGEAKWAKIQGYDNVAAKTGTAQIPVAGHYDPTNTNHSFVAFAPVGHPKFIMLVTLESPQSSLWAAETAAPLWFSIARELFPYLGVQPGKN
jgi:cell division protein FtsI (penicillin-binding protein 3)